MPSVSIPISHASIHRESNTSRNDTLSWDMSSIPAGSTINSIRIQMYLGITARTSGYARVQKASDNSVEYLREYRSGTYTTSAVASSWISSITLTFRADSTVYLDFSNFYAIVDYTVGYSASTTNSVTVEAGQTAYVTISNTDLAVLSHTINFVFGYESSGAISLGQGVGSTSFTIPLSWLQQFTAGSYGVGQIVCETYSGGTLIGTTYAQLTVTVPDSAAPTVSLSLVQTGDARPDGWGMYLQTFSGVDLIASVQTQYLATVSSINFSDGTRDGSNQYISHVAVLFSAGAKTFAVTVIDSRGKSSTAYASITVEPYSSPVFNATRIARCDASGTETDPDGTPMETGTYINALADVQYSSCNTHNTIAIAIDVDVDNVWVPVGNLSNAVQATLSAPPTSDFPSGFDPATIYKFRIQAVDAMGKSVARVLYLQSISMLMHFRNTEDGMAIGMVSRRAGCEINPTWPFYAHGKEIIDLIYPVGSIYMSVANTSPATLFGGTWVQIEDTFLLAAGQTYAAGATGGEAAHTLSLNEMPAHDHGIYSGYGDIGDPTTDSDAFRYQYWGGSNRGFHDTFISSTGGGAAHNNMPPYLVVYVWKRTA